MKAKETKTSLSEEEVKDIEKKALESFKQTENAFRRQHGIPAKALYEAGDLTGPKKKGG